MDRQQDFKKTEAPVGTEKFTFFENAEKDLAYVLWPKEEEALRYVYRYICVAESVRDEFVRIVEEMNHRTMERGYINDQFYWDRISNTVSGFNLCVSQALRMQDPKELEKSLSYVKILREYDEESWENVNYAFDIEKHYSSYIFIKKLPIYGTFVVWPIFVSVLILSYFIFPDFYLYTFIENMVAKGRDAEIAQERTTIILFTCGTFLNLVFFYFVCISSLNPFFRRARNQRILYKTSRDRFPITVAKFKESQDFI
jgi:hypothetical protein